MKIARISNLPRLSVFRSNRHIVAQIIDDIKGETVVAVSDKTLAKGKSKVSGPRTEVAGLVGMEIGKRAKAKKISKVTFDRGAYKYHGLVKALADGARKGGLNF